MWTRVGQVIKSFRAGDLPGNFRPLMEMGHIFFNVLAKCPKSIETQILSK